MVLNAQRRWAARPVAERLRVIRGFRRRLAAAPDELLAAARARPGRSDAETLTAEILPLAEACRFLEREAGGLLAPRRPAGRRPFWLRGVDLRLHREPLGRVLILAAANYPVFLPGVQLLQALAAGNAVLLKPGAGGGPAARALARLLAAAGLPEDLVEVLPDTVEAGRAALASRPDHVLLTGEVATGRAVLRELAAELTPATLELSGDDPVFVLPGADLDRVGRALRFGRALNGGETCIAPRRVFAVGPLAEALRPGLPESLELIPVESPEAALQAAAESPYALGAAVFGPEAEARALAARIRAGVVVVNDLIVPTADPRLPFGGRGWSGYGVTRGAEGLLSLTAVKAVSVRRGRWVPHLDPAHPEDARLFRGYLAAIHGGRLAGWIDLIRAAWGRRAYAGS